MNSHILIPAFEPSAQLVPLVEQLSAQSQAPIVIVDDGSGPSFAPIFERAAAIPRVRVLRHAVNLGKGAALKTGINACLCDDPAALIVTADADGQHLAEDILRVAQTGLAHPQALLLGARSFDGEVPLRSRLGNRLTRHVLRLVLGYALDDTQTGLRAIPPSLSPRLLTLTSRGYEFELDMLIACKRFGIPIRETPIRTVYLDGNASSHFNPLLDSMRIYFTLIRFTLSSVVTALIDNLAFVALFAGLASILPSRPAVLLSQLGGRGIAMAFNYTVGKRLVFASAQRHVQAFPRYLLLVVAAGVVSFMMITYLSEVLGLGVVPAKMLSEGLLFVPSFVIQRDLVFRNPARDELVDPAR